MTFPELYSLLPPLFVYSTTAQLELPPDYLDEFEGENFSFGRDGANGFVLVVVLDAVRSVASVVFVLVLVLV